MLQLLILLLTVFMASGTECPAMCICKHFPRGEVPTNYYYYASAKCEGFDSNATLNNFTKTLEVSNLDDRSFSNLVVNLVEGDLLELNTLVLKHSALGNVTNLLQTVGNQIKFLALYNNNLTIIPELGDELSAIVSLSFAHNEIAYIPPYQSLRTLRTLEELNLSENLIEQIDGDSFKNLTNLKTLDLSHNNLSSLDSQFLTPLVSLQYLNLNHNRIEVLNDKCFSNLTMLQQLDVSWNNLARVTPGSLQLPSLARLLLEGNPQLEDAYEILVGVGQKVHTVDVSWTGLKQVPEVLTHSIRTLKLAGNLIHTLTCGEMDAYPLVQFLDFNLNHIVSVEEDTLGRLESLSILYMSDNKLRSIPKSLPEGLKELHLERNAIEKLARDDLKGLSNLEVLLLNDNKITILEGEFFSYLGSLVTLDLSRNPIERLYPGCLSGPTALQILRLSGVDTVSPAEDVSFPLSVPDHLVSLDLSGSSGLARQLLADTATLAASRELQELDISSADLEFIRSDLLHFLPQLRIMHVGDNPLNCTNLQWLAVWMRRQNQAEYRSITCVSPAELCGTPLLDLQYAQNPPIKQINHGKVLDFQGTINHITESTAVEKNSPLGKYVTERMAYTSTPIFNGSVNSSMPEKIPINNENPTAVAINEIVTKKSDGEEYGPVKRINNVLVPSADMGLSSLIQALNSRAEFRAAETGTASKDFHKTGAANTERPTNDSDLVENSSRNNEPAGTFNKTRAWLNLTPNERIFNDTSGLTEQNGNGRRMQQALDKINMTENMSEWNASTVKTSMYRNEDIPIRLLHPGLLILAVGVLGGAATIATLAARLNNRKRWRENRNENSEAIPVTSISSVTELW